MAAPTFYASTDASAPTLSGTAGQMSALLKACLVDGYGSKAAAGWTAPFSGTNGFTFLPGAGPQFYYHVNDNAPVTAKEAQIRGSETASAFNTGTGFFDSANQAILKKSSTADSTVRAWYIVADNRTCNVHIQWLAANTNYGFGTFGEFYSYKTSDAYKALVLSMKATANNDVATDSSGYPGGTATSSAIARSYTQLGASVRLGMFIGFINTWGSEGAATSALWPFPNGPDGGLYIAAATVTESKAGPAIRGEFRGPFGTLHQAASFATGDTFDGVGLYGGRSFRVGPPWIGTGNAGSRIVYETTAWPVSP